MSTKRDLVEAHGYNRRRLVTAFVSGAPGGREVEPVRHGRTVVGGVVLAAIIVAGAAVSGFLQKPPRDDWDQQGLVIGEASGSRYFASQGTLFPIINITSARLLLPDGVDPVTIDDDLIGQRDKGATIGIAGAPEIPPPASALVEEGWTACTNAGGGVRLSLPGTPVATEADDQALVVTDDQDRGWLLANGARFAIPGGRTGELVLRTLGLDAVQPQPVTGVWLDLFPEAGSLAEPEVPGGTARVDTGVAGLDTPGTPVEADGDRTYVLTGDGRLAETTPFAHQIWTAERTPFQIDAADLQKLRTDPEVRPYDEDWPVSSVSPFTTPATPCVVMDTVEDGAPELALATPIEPTGEGASQPVPTDQGISRDVVVGGGAVVRSISGGVLDSGAVFLVDGSGVACAVGEDGDGSVLGRLGYAEDTPRPVPQAWMALLDSGPELTPVAAASRPNVAGGTS